MIKNKTLSLFSALSLVLILLFGGYEYYLFNESNKKSDEFRETMSRRESLLHKLEDSLGYGGAIHHFKNYILRGPKGSEQYYDKAQKKILLGLATLEDIEKEFPEYREHLPPIRSVFLKYLSALDLAHEKITTGIKISELDSLVKIDDGAALKAEDNLRMVFTQQKKSFREIHTQNIRKLKKTFLIVFFFVGLSFVVLLYSYDKRLKKVLEKQVQYARDKEAFVRKMTHEIRTPLNAMIGFQNFIEEDQLDEEGRESLKNIKVSSQYLLSLINNIMDFSKLKANRMVIHPEEVEEREFWHTFESLLMGLKKPQQRLIIDLPQ